MTNSGGSRTKMLRARVASLFWFPFLLASCAAPLERTNRFFFGFNDAVDGIILRPLASAYNENVPGFARTGIRNVFWNLDSINVILNDLAQGKWKQGYEDSLRFVYNSTMGIGGLFDVSTPIGLERHDEDFGQSLGKWGVPSGPYLVLPIFGPSSFRDAWSIPFATAANPVTYVGNSAVSVPARVTNAVSERAAREGAVQARDESALDRYVFTREAYLQRREFLVHDGEVPREDVEDELEDLLDELEDL